jgi:drug/metabolite transporter (DMT)-like permease
MRSPDPTPRRADTAAFAALVLGAAAMGASPIFVRLAEVGPFASAFWRVLLALPALWAWASWEARAHRGRLRDGVGPVALVAGALFAGDLFFWHLSITSTTVANATFFATTAPFWVVFGAWLMKSEAVGRRTIGGLVLAGSGGLLLIGESLHVDPARALGDLYGLITAIFFGGYFLAIRAARRSGGAARITFASSVVTAALLGVVAAALEPTLLPASWRGAAALVALALVSHAAGQGLLSFALGHLPATFSSLVIFLEAVAAALLGWVALGEALSWVQVAGGVIILGAVLVARPTGPRTGDER